MKSENRRIWLKRTIKFTGIGILIVLSFGLACNTYVNSYSSEFISDDIAKLPTIEYALIPGTSKFFSKNDKNTFYQSRLNAAFLLYKMKRVKKIIVSGTSEKFYDEPKQLRTDLKNMGIPDSVIISDSSGVHTLESVQFLERTNTDSVIIVSQYAHLQRAVFLACKSGIKAYGYAAPDPIDDL